MMGEMDIHFYTIFSWGHLDVDSFYFPSDPFMFMIIISHTITHSVYCY